MCIYFLLHTSVQGLYLSPLLKKKKVLEVLKKNLLLTATVYLYI